MTTIFCIFDGFGLLPKSENNCIALANMPHFRSLLKDNFWTTLNADGVSVGQEAGLVGNSEVGHMNLGGLQQVSQLSYQITKSSEKNFKLDKAIAKDQEFDPVTRLIGSKKVHLIGLFSTGTIHSDLRHWSGAIHAANNANIEKIVLHLITDGRDSDRASFIETLEGFVAGLTSEIKSKLFIGSYGGRAYAMDRDNNFEKVYYGLQAMFGVELIEKTIDLRDKFNIKSFETANFINKELNINQAPESIKKLVDTEYQNSVFDEFLKPTCFEQIQDGELIWLINFRSDRMRQIVKMLCKYVSQDKGHLKHKILAMNDYGIEGDGYEFIFHSKPIDNNFSYFAQKLGKTQLHTAETEKYNHVTYFFNGGQDKKQKNEDWVLIPSNKLQNHSEKPEMKAKEVTDTILESIGKYDYIIVNYANPDMVGHCGDVQAGIESMEFLDLQLGRLLFAVEQGGHKMVLTADHGNMEFVGPYSRNGKSLTDTEHNPSPVPLIIIDKNFDKSILEKKINDFCSLNSIKFDRELLQAVLSENNQTEGNWLEAGQIPSPQLQLWYAGLIAFCM
jgi:2,3-bisphosphoglycerate-independent phosphoglycerate mutase